MAVTRVASRAQLGLHAPLVHVEVHLGSGLPTFSIVGLAATAVKESKERVRAALVNCGFELPAGRITVNLAPADLPKEGGRYDLPIALGVLLASGQLGSPARRDALATERYEFYGELALTGELKPVRGLLLAAAHAAEAQHRMVVPRANADEALVALRTGVCGAAHLLEVCGHLRGEAQLPECPMPVRRPSLAAAACGDLRDVRGQLQAKRALAIAAAGHHSLLMCGPPGAGKSMLAQRPPALLPPLTDAEALEVATIASASAAGFDPATFGQRPFRSPHHTASAHAIIGGGPQVRPGEVSLAHRGVLFLDELPEFDRRVREALREPLETGVVSVSRAAHQVRYPADFQLVAAMNPCPCGYRGAPGGRCRCQPAVLARYAARLSGPLLDRIDLRIELPDVTNDELGAAQAGESSASIAARVRAARERQLARSGRLNAQLGAAELDELCRLDSASESLLWRSRSKLGLSARGLHRLLRVARTIADLDASAAVRRDHLAEALQLRRPAESVA